MMDGLRAEAMSREAFERGDWRAVIRAHPLESHDPQEWLRYGIALLQTLTPGPDLGRQQQQAALAFVQAGREGATAEEIQAAQRRSALISLQEGIARAKTQSSMPAGRPVQSPPPPVQLLHLHGFKCAGSTFAWSLERATQGGLLYVESPRPNQRLAWQRIRDHVQALEEKPAAITSHLATLPPQDQLARLKVAFVRDPLQRIISAFRFETTTQNKHGDLSFEAYLKRHSRGALANYQTRHLSPQEEKDWDRRKGWSARPELIRLKRPDLFVGVVERYDASIVVLEHRLESLGIRLDLAYPQPMNTTRQQAADEIVIERLPSQLVLDATELDERLYQRACALLEQNIRLIPDFEARLEAFRIRCAALHDQRPAIRLKPSQDWLRLG